MTVLLEAVWYSLVSIVGFRTLLTATGLWAEVTADNIMSTDRGSIILAVVLALLAVAAGIMIVQCSYIVGRLANRARGIVVATTLLVSAWLVFRLGMWLAPLFRWMPPIRFGGTTRVDGVARFETSFFSLAPAIGAFCVVLALFWIGSVLLERDVEL